MMIQVTFVSPGNFNWQSINDNSGVIASGTGTSVANAGQQAVAAIRSYCTSQRDSFISLGTGWQ